MRRSRKHETARAALEPMACTRASLHLLQGSSPGAINPLRVAIRAGSVIRTFHPHVREAWECIVRPISGGPGLLTLVRGTVLPRDRRREPRH